MKATKKQGGQPGNKNATKPDDQKRLQLQFGLTQQTSTLIDRLVEAGYAKNRSQVVTKLVKTEVEKLFDLSLA